MAVMVGGAYLIAVWAVGIVLVFGGLLLGADAVLRDDGRPVPGDTSSHQQILERWKRAS